MNLRQPGSVPAFIFSIGQSFIWKGEMYTVVDLGEEDQDPLRVKDKLGLELNFNPYAYVFPVKE